MPTDFDVILFDGYAAKKLPPTGNFFCFYCVPDGLKLKTVVENNQPVTIDDASVLDWQRENPMLRGLSLRKIWSQHQLKLDVPADDEVLIDGMKGPMMILHHEGGSTFLVLSFDLVNSTWPLQPSWPAVFFNALQYMALGSDLDVRQSFVPGATPRISRTNLLKAGVNLKSIRLNGPMGSSEIPIPASGDFVLPPLDQVGVYSTDPPVPQFERIAVNLLDSNESNLMPLEKPPGGISGDAVVVANKKSRLELWWWIVACGALPLLMIEWWVYTRRVHL